MRVRELIEALRGMPQDADVWYLYDGAARGSADVCYLARSGEVMLGFEEAVVYYDEDRPADAPSVADAPYWQLLHRPTA